MKKIIYDEAKAKEFLRIKEIYLKQERRMNELIRKNIITEETAKKYLKELSLKVFGK
jgi:hypothetical protein